MKNIRRSVGLVSSIFMCSLIVSSLGFAQANNGDELPSPPTEAPEEVQAEGQGGTRAENREQRNAERKAQAEEQITIAQQQRVASRCAAAQTKLDSAVQKAQEVETNRSDAYANIVTKLNSLVLRLQASSIDTTALEAQIAAFDNEVSAFFNAFETYQLALSDAAEVDCESDTESFLLALQDARQQNALLKQSAMNLRTYVKDTIGGTLEDIRSTLDSGTNNDSGEEA